MFRVFLTQGPAKKNTGSGKKNTGSGGPKEIIVKGFRVEYQVVGSGSDFYFF